MILDLDKAVRPIGILVTVALAACSPGADAGSSGMAAPDGAHEGDDTAFAEAMAHRTRVVMLGTGNPNACLLYTSPSPRDKRQSRMPSSA